MYLLKDESQYKPMAIIKNNFPHKVHQAVKEEFGFTEIKMEGFAFPDYVDDTEIYYVGTTEDGEEVTGTVVLTQLVDY